MQCILYKIYFWKGSSYVLQIDMHLICAPMLTKFYSCKKWVLHYLSEGTCDYSLSLLGPSPCKSWVTIYYYREGCDTPSVTVATTVKSIVLHLVMAVDQRQLNLV
jgi:uncharacterized protein (DUF2237 family)